MASIGTAAGPIRESGGESDQKPGSTFFLSHKSLHPDSLPTMPLFTTPKAKIIVVHNASYRLPVAGEAPPAPH